MAGKKIGIKVADGAFYPVLDPEAGQRKKMVLTTTHDYQEKVQIDFYLGEENSSPEELISIGGMRMEKVEPEEQGRPEVTLFLSVDEEGNLIARAVDEVVGEDESKVYVIPYGDDSSLSFDEDAFDDLRGQESPDFGGESSYFPSLPSEVSEQFPQEQERETAVPRRKGNPFFALGFTLIGLFLIALLSFLFFRQFEKGEQPPLQAEETTAYQEVPDLRQNDGGGTPGGVSHLL